MRHQFTKRHKYNVGPKEKRTRDGILFDSIKEAMRYDQLQVMVKENIVTTFLRQTPIHLPGNTRYVVDFLIFWADGKCTFEDVKGMETPEFKMKKKQVEALYPFEITVRK